MRHPAALQQISGEDVNLTLTSDEAALFKSALNECMESLAQRPKEW
jgi:hypothetical protein